jgi:hypothetical protein
MNKEIINVAEYPDCGKTILGTGDHISVSQLGIIGLVIGQDV